MPKLVAMILAALLLALPAAGQDNLGFMNAGGQGVPQDDAEAVKCGMGGRQNECRLSCWQPEGRDIR